MNSKAFFINFYSESNLEAAFLVKSNSQLNSAVLVCLTPHIEVRRK